MPNFEDVKAAEQDELREARKRRRDLFKQDGHEMPEPEDKDRVGLAFSGGGIRSATFNLGILQGLARYNLLQRIDYISTVSGGGYISSWLISWIRRRGLKEVIEKLASSPPTSPEPPPPPLMGPATMSPPGEPYCEAKPVNFLREYSNYLTPKLGLFGADTWAAIATYIRNLLLNLTILISILSAFLLLPRFWEAIFLEIARYGKASADALHVTAWGTPFIPGSLSTAIIVAALVLAAMYSASWNIASNSFKQLLSNRFTEEMWVFLGVIVPLLVAAPLGSISLWLASANLHNVGWAYWALWGSIAYGTLRSVALILSALKLRLQGLVPDGGWPEELENAGRVAGWAFVAGPVGGILVGAIARQFYVWAPLANNQNAPQAWGIARVACWGTPFVIAALLLTGVLHIGLMSIYFSNQKREWWARMTGWLLICSIIGAGLFGLGIYAPLGISLLSGYAKTKGTLIGGWILSTLGGLLAGKNGATSGASGGNTKLEIAATVAPYVFVVGLLAALSFGVHGVVTPSGPPLNANAFSAGGSAKVSGDLQLTARDSAGQPAVTLTDLKLTYSTKPSYNAQEIKKKFWAEVERSSDKRQLFPCLSLPGWAWLFGGSLILAGLALALSMRVDINEFSMHLLYRNRLVRCYLGASNGKRKRQRFTGFDPADDTLLKEFSKNAKAYEKAEKYAGPYPILNCTLNLTHGDNLAWQERKGESFVFTPRFCGYDFQEQVSVKRRAQEDETKINMAPTNLPERNLDLINQHGKIDGYRETENYAYLPGGVYLGTALATSGAAVSPNMGYHTSPPLAFLMTVFNVRLGWWLGNPQREDTWKKSTPDLGLFYLLAELFAATNDRSGYVYLSDGFHFENLGLYELVRRRCKYVVVGDAGADPEHSFDDLANAIRKCRTDFGIEIEIDLTPLKLDAHKKYSPAHCVVGRIRYDLIGAGLEPGILVYYKPTLTESDPADVQNYKTLHQAFPHQPTANQWFDESQFESYRQLGRVTMESTLESAGNPDQLAGMNTAKVFESLSQML